MTRDEAERVAIDALAFLAGDGERLGRFLALSGLEVGSLRAAAAEPAFLAGLLAHLVGDERAVLDFAAASGRDPGAAAEALAALGGREAWDSA